MKELDATTVSALISISEVACIRPERLTESASIVMPPAKAEGLPPSWTLPSRQFDGRRRKEKPAWRDDILVERTDTILETEVGVAADAKDAEIGEVDEIDDVGGSQTVAPWEPKRSPESVTGQSRVSMRNKRLTVI